MKTIVILADGEYPVHPEPLGLIKEANEIICCDGSAGRLVSEGVIPDAIVGDMDSLSDELKERFSSIIHKDDCQETNDLTKAFRYAALAGADKIIILGATGLREDHTLGNISLLSMYQMTSEIPVEMWTDHGVFYAINKNSSFNSYPGCQISVFALDCGVRIESNGLKFPLHNVIFDSWWKGTLNECTSDTFSLKFINPGRVIIFVKYQ